MTHDEIQLLLGAYALDAIEGDEAEEVEGHLAVCPRCRDELAGYREVTGLFAYAGAEAPEGLWDRIAASMQAEPPPLRMDRIRQGMAERGSGAPAGGGRAAGRFAGRRGAQRRRSARATGFLAVAAAAAIVVLSVSIVHLHDRMQALHNQAGGPVPVATATMAEVRKALASPGRRKVVLRPPAVGGSHAASLDVVIEPDGTAFLYDAKLTPLPADRVYQLWGVVGSRRISYGLLGTDPRVEEFQAGSGLQQLAVTDEVASGVVQSTQPFTVSGPVRPPL